MGVIQNSVNNAMSGTAFLLSQSGALDDVRNKYTYKQNMKDIETAHQARMEGIAKSNSMLTSDNEEADQIANEAIAEHKQTLFNKETEDYAELVDKANLKSTNRKVRDEAIRNLEQKKASTELQDYGQMAYQSAVRDLQIRNEQITKQQKARQDLLNMIKNPMKYSDEQIKNIKEEASK